MTGEAKQHNVHAQVLIVDDEIDHAEVMADALRKPGHVCTIVNDLAGAKERHREELLGLPNVVGVGVGPKTVGGRPTNVMAIKVYVRRKVPEQELAEAELVPETIEGVPTDVEEQAPMRAC